MPGGQRGGERGFGGGAGGRAGRGAGRLAVVDDPLGGEDSLAGPQQRGAGSAMVLSDAPPGNVGGSDIGYPRGPGAGQNRAGGGAPGSQAGGDERRGCREVLGADQHRRGLAEQAGPVVHGVDDVAVAPAGVPVGRAEVADEFSATAGEDGQPAAEPVSSDEHGESAGRHGGRPIRPTPVVQARPQGGQLRLSWV